MLLILSLKKEPECSVAQLQRGKGHYQENYRQAQVVVAKVAGVLDEEGVERHHRKRDDL